MPLANARRQPDSAGEAWFRRPDTQRLVKEVQRQATPELTRVFGHTGLYLRPCASMPAPLSGNMLASVVSLHRCGDRLGGEVACADALLPLLSGSLSLVYGLFVLETSPDPQALLQEVARTLKPEGVALLVALNPWGLSRMRWSFKGLRSFQPGALADQATQAGLEVRRRRFLGPMWSSVDAAETGLPKKEGLGARLRVAHLLVARRREAGLTPLRGGTPALKLRPGMSAG